MFIGTRRRLHVGGELLTEGIHPEAIYLLLEMRAHLSRLGTGRAFT